MNGRPATDDTAASAITTLLAAGATVAVAESLTGGALGAALTAVPGASKVFVGGIVAYATPLKTRLLGVPADVLERAGPVDEAVALAMAAGARCRLGATYGVALTGVAGPDPQGGKPPGTVWLAVSSASGQEAQLLRLTGGRSEVRAQAVARALELLQRVACVASAGNADVAPTG